MSAVDGGRGPRAWQAGLIYLGLALAVTWPLALQAQTHCWGARYDLWGNLWLMGFFHHALFEGPLSLSTNGIFYPEGISVWVFAHFLLQLLVSPLLSVVSPPAAYAVLTWAALAGSALAMYALAAYVVGDRWAAFVAGGIYGFNGLAYAELAVGSVEQAATFGLPLSLLCLLRWQEAGGWRWGVASYLAILLTALGNWFFGMALAVLGLLYVVFHALRAPVGGSGWSLDRGLLVRASLLSLALALTVLPAMSRVLPQTLARPGLSQDLLEPEATVSEDAEDAVPYHLSQIEPETVSALARKQTLYDSLSLDRLLPESLGTMPRSAGPGFQLLGLALLGLVLGGVRARFWLFAFVLLTVVSLGPFLRWTELGAAEKTPLPYYYAYNAVPVFRVAYRPYRFQSTALVAGAVLAAFGVAGVLRRARPRHRAALAVALFATVLFVRWQLCSPGRVPLLLDARPPPLYAALPQKEEAPALIEFPFHHWMFGDSNARFQYYQIIHGRPILNNSQFINLGQLLRLQRLLAEHPTLLTLMDGQYARQVQPPPTLERDLRWLREVGFGCIVVHTAFPRDPLHLTGHQEQRQMVTEGFIGFLESRFGPPSRVAGGLVFDLSASGRGGPGPVAALLDFPGDYARSRAPVPLKPGQPLRWDVARPASRLAFWAVAEPGTGTVQVAVKRGGAWERHQVGLSEDEWQRVVVDLEPDGGPVEAVLIEAPVGREATASISQVQLLGP